MTATIDEDKCIGCSLCAEQCPAVFRMEGDKAIAYATPVPSSGEQCCREAADACPVNAIIIE